MIGLGVVRMRTRLCSPIRVPSDVRVQGGCIGSGSRGFPLTTLTVQVFRAGFLVCTASFPNVTSAPALKREGAPRDNILDPPLHKLEVGTLRTTSIHDRSHNALTLTCGCLDLSQFSTSDGHTQSQENNHNILDKCELLADS